MPSDIMNGLTDEQRRRIEENRRKALEKRAAKTHTLNGNQNGNSTLLPTTVSIKDPSGTSNNYFAQNGNLCGSNHMNTTKPSILPRNQRLLDRIDKIPIKFQINNEVLKGRCVLLSKERFYVDVGYKAEVIDVFKQVPSRMYDAKTRKWNFLIEHHDKLISLCRPMEPQVLIAPLPWLVVKMFLNAKKKVDGDIDLSGLDPVLKNSLLPFQREGVEYGIRKDGRVLIADDMGLGKTIQAIAIVNYYNEWPLLVVTPSSVRYSWLEAFHTWLPSLEKEEITVINSGKDHIPNNKAILMSYDLLSKMQDAIIMRKFKAVVMDESHFIKNPKSSRTKAAQAIMNNVKRIIMLTGTPALSRPIELYTQISALQSRDFFTYKQYGVRYCNGKTNHWGWDCSGSSNMEELRILLEECVMIRRLKSEVLKQLPPKTRQIIMLDPSRLCSKNKVLKAMAAKLKRVELKGMERRGVLLEYFHETGIAKLPAVVEYIADLLENDQKFLCFAHHQHVLDGICERIENKEVDYIRIDGAVKSEDRKRLCDKFQNNDDCKVAVLSITAANAGITLTAASLVMFAELFWNPGILVQAEDRAHRIGQEDSVTVQYLVAKGTADDEMWSLVKNKLDVLSKAGLSKDNFRDADLIEAEESEQSQMEDYWNLVGSFDDDENFSATSAKKPKIESHVE